MRRRTSISATIAVGVAALVASLLITPATAEAASKPGSTNTGVPSSVKLTKKVGDITVTKAGTVLSGLDIYGTVTVKAANVTITKSRVRGNTKKVDQDLIRGTTGSDNLKVIDVTVKPDSPTKYHGIGIRLTAKNQLVQRANVSGTIDGVRIYGTNARVESSWLHDFKHYSASLHDDAIQIQGGSGHKISGNNFSGAYNAGVMVNQNLSTIANLTIGSNWADGGGCTINMVKGSRPKINKVSLDSNRFGRAQRNKNCAVVYKKAEVAVSASKNVWDNNGSAVKLNAY